MWEGKVNGVPKYPALSGWDLAFPMMSDILQRSPSFSANACMHADSHYKTSGYVRFSKGKEMFSVFKE